MTKGNNEEVSQTGTKASPHIASVAVATPPLAIDQKKAREFLITHYTDRLSSRGRAILHKVFCNPSIVQRNFAFGEPETLVDEDPDSRIVRYMHWAVELSAQAIEKALAQNGLSVHNVEGLVVNTCTGYLCPGISTYLIEKLGLPRHIRAYDLVGSGCGGAIPNLQVAESLVNGGNGGVVLSVSVEICSATFQMDDDVSLIISNALFGDGAAASVVWGRPEGFEMIASAGYFAPEHREAIRYVHKNGQLYNQISLSLPHIVKKAVSQVVTNLLKPESLQVKDIKHWAIHTGGEKIIGAIQEELGLSDNQLLATRHTLAKYGNMSSPTVWFVLREILDRGVDEGDLCIMVAFGAGLSAYAYLLRKK